MTKSLFTFTFNFHIDDIRKKALMNLSGPFCNVGL